jgi:hypothetical protein
MVCPAHYKCIMVAQLLPLVAAVEMYCGHQWQAAPLATQLLAGTCIYQPTAAYTHGLNGWLQTAIPGLPCF